ncbi:MAG: polysaccharide biosynthesis tyrosine autokinase [Cyanobacteria bacterium J06621_15]
MNNTEYPIAVEIKSSEDLNIDFQQYWFAFKRRWLSASVIAGGVFTLGCMGIMLLSKTYYSAEGKILVKPDESATLTGLLTDNKNQLTPLTLQGNPLKTETEIILSKPVIDRVINSLIPLDENDKPISNKDIKINLQVEEIKGTDILEISYKSSNPRVAAFVVNEMMKAYVENNKSVNRAEALAAKKFIAKQLPETQESVRQAENALRRFKETNQLVAIDEEAKLSLETVEKLKSQIAEVKSKFAEINAKYSALINQLGIDSQQAILVAKLSQSQAVQATLTDIQAAERELRLARIRFQNNNPTILNLEEKLTSLNAQLQQRIIGEIGSNRPINQQYLQAGELELGLVSLLINLQVERVGLSNQISSLENNLSQYQNRINSLPKLKEEEREIQRRLEAAQATYETLLTKLKEIEAVGNQNIVNARIIEEALVPNKPSLDTKIILLLLINSVSSFVLFVAAVAILEKLDPSLKNVKSIQKILPYSLLATFPNFKTQQDSQEADPDRNKIFIPVLDNPTLPISEVYRMLQANLDFIDSTQKSNVIVVSSSVPQEGKSTIAANLAAVFAESKKKVLLIDADVRNPSQHHAWELTNQLGLSNAIVGRANLSTAIKIIQPNLHVLTSGVTPPNPVTLLKSQAMANLIKQASENYHYVVIDAPPILMAADALILGKLANGILMVSRPGIIDANSLVKTKDLLEKSGQNVLGLVINGIILKNESDSYFHFTENYASGNTNKRKVLSKKAVELK